MTLENGRKREKNKIGRLTEVYPSLFIVEYNENSDVPGAINNSYVESYTYSDILTEKHWFVILIKLILELAYKRLYRAFFMLN